MRKPKLLLAIAFVAVVAVVLFLVMRRQSDKPEQVKVGVILPLTGILSEMGQYERQAMEMAADDLRTNGYQIKLVFEDGKGDNKAVAAAANKLFDIDGVQTLVTSTTGASLTAKPICESRKSVLLAFCTSSDVAANSPTTVRFYIGNEEETKALLANLQNLPKEIRVGILHANLSLWIDSVEKFYLPTLRNHFVNPVIVEPYELKDKDFRPHLTKLKNEKVSVLVILGYGFEYEPIFNQMVELKMRDTLQIYGGWGFLYTGLAPSLLEGIKVAGPQYVYDRGVSGSDFESRYRQRYSRVPNFDAAFAYEAVMRLRETLLS